MTTVGSNNRRDEIAKNLRMARESSNSADEVKDVLTFKQVSSHHR